MKRKFRAIPGKGVFSSTKLNKLRKNIKASEGNWIDEDDFYNMDPEEFWETYLSGAEWELSDELDIYIEPSIQLGAGSIYIHDESDDDNESIGVDYQEWIEHEQALAGEADSAAEFKDMMREYIRGLMKDAGWDR